MWTKFEANKLEAFAYFVTPGHMKIPKDQQGRTEVK